MAGDWIAMRTALADDQAVIALTARFRGVLADEDHTVGKLHRLWSWADGQTETGVVMGVDLEWIDRRVGVPGFGLAMTELQPRPWLQVIEGGVRFPRWEEWNSESAKARLKEARRKRRQRRTSQRTRDKCPGSGGTNVPAHAGQMSGGNGDKCPGAGGTDPGPQDRTGQNRTEPDRTGQEQEINQPESGSGASAREEAVRPGPARSGSNGSRPLRKGPERQNEVLALMAREPQPAGVAWVQRFANTMFEVNRRVQPQMTGAEWQQQRANVLAVGDRLIARADRNELAAEFIELSIRKRQAKDVERPWAAWQALVNQRLKASG